MTQTTVAPPLAEPTDSEPRAHSRWAPLAIAIAGVAALSLARIVGDNADLTSSGTFGVALQSAAPILLAGLSGIYAERSGTINIGLDGMMVLGTIFAGWWGWELGVWWAIPGGIVGGLLGGLLMSVATTTFGVNHIVAGVAINLLAPGVARFMANTLFSGVPGGSVTNSPGNDGDIGSFTLPVASGGELFGWESPDVLGWLEERGWFIVADIAGLLKGITANVSYDLLLTVGVLVLTVWILWHTPFGLRLRAAGERPAAADSLGVSVTRMRYYGMAISGSLAGMGGALLVLYTNRYSEGQVSGRGFFGLATMIFGNWRPFGTAVGAGIFGYASGITLRTNPQDLVRVLFLAIAIAVGLAAVWLLVSRQWRGFGVVGLLGAGAFWAYFAIEQPNNQLVYITPFVVVLIAVSVRASSLRPPAEEGIPWYKGSQ